jgi:hypothetical protein
MGYGFQLLSLLAETDGPGAGDEPVADQLMERPMAI